MFGKPTHDADGNEILYEASLHNLHRFGCYASRLIPQVQCRQGKLGQWSKPCMMVGYTHDSKTLWRIWNPEFQSVKTQSEVVFDEERNAHMSCQHRSNKIDMFGSPEDEEYGEETDIRDEPLRDSQPTQIRSQPTQIRKRSKSHMHDAPDEEAENAHSRPLCREDQTAWRSAVAIKKLSQGPPAAPAPTIGSSVTRSQGKASAEASTASAQDPYTYAEAMESPQQDHQKRAM